MIYDLKNMGKILMWLFIAISPVKMSKNYWKQYLCSTWIFIDFGPFVLDVYVHLAAKSFFILFVYSIFVFSIFYRRRMTKFNTAPSFKERIKIISSPPWIDIVTKMNTNKRLKFICKIVSVLKLGNSGSCHVSQTTTISLLLLKYVFPSRFISFQWKYHQYHAFFSHNQKQCEYLWCFQCVREECFVLVNTVRVAFYLSISAQNKYYYKQYMPLYSRWHFICAFEIYINKLCKYFNKRFKIQRNFLFILLLRIQSGLKFKNKTNEFFYCKSIRCVWYTTCIIFHYSRTFYTKILKLLTTSTSKQNYDFERNPTKWHRCL